MMNTLTPPRPEEQLFGLLKEHGHCDLLLDCTLGNPLREEIAAARLNEPPAPINPAAVAIEPDACPVLIRVSTDNLALLDASIAVAQRHAAPKAQSKPVCAWLFGATTNVASVARHLERQAIVREPRGGKSYLRFHDPRTFAQLLHITTAEQRARLLGPINCWVWMDRTGRMQSTLRAPGTEVNNSQGSVTFTPEQDWAVDQIERVNQTLLAFENLSKPWPTEDDAQLLRWLAEAQSKGYWPDADQVAYVLHAALVHPQFDRHPAVVRAIDAVRRDGGDLCEALGQFDESFWGKVPSDMRHSASPAPI